MKSKVIFAALMAVGACSRSNESLPDSSVVTVTPASPVITDTAKVVRNPCEHTGMWAECSLERRLKQSGFVVKKLEERPDREGFTTTPVVYSLGSSRLEAFFYKDEKSANRDIAAIDTVALAPKGKPGAWPSTPLLIRSANLVAVLMSQNPRQAERVVLGITAGPPQPGSPR